MLLTQDQTAQNSPGATHSQETHQWPFFEAISVPP